MEGKRFFLMTIGVRRFYSFLKTHETPTCHLDEIKNNEDMHFLTNLQLKNCLAFSGDFKPNFNMATPQHIYR